MLTSSSSVVEVVIAAETEALGRWGSGDPDGFLEICDPEVTYFDPFISQRIDGLVALREYYERLRGQVQIDHFQLFNPRVVAGADLAVLSFNFVSTTGTTSSSWNCTEVYRRNHVGWRILQTHWSFARPASS